MTSFTDKAGRKWSLALTVGAVKRVESLTGVSLGVIGQETFATLAGDCGKLVDVIGAVLRPQLAEEGVSDEDFAEALGGDELSAATDALLAALVDFSPPKKRPLLQKAIERAGEWTDQAMMRATAHLESLTLDDVSGALSSNAPESSDAIPADGRLRVYSPPPTLDCATNGT